MKRPAGVFVARACEAATQTRRMCVSVSNVRCDPVAKALSEDPDETIAAAYGMWSERLDLPGAGL
jgi:hypothetical protein